MIKNKSIESILSILKDDSVTGIREVLINIIFRNDENEIENGIKQV